MTLVSDVATAIGYAWECAVLLIVGSIAVAAVKHSIECRIERRRARREDVRLVRALAGCWHCAPLADPTPQDAWDVARLNAAYRAPAAEER